MAKRPCVYILASKRNGTLYVGVTSNLGSRVALHRENAVIGFTSRYAVHRLIWFEEFEDMPSAIHREKQLNNCNRCCILRLIERANPDWRDLWAEIV
jgi:putative endonuclease